MTSENELLSEHGLLGKSREAALNAVQTYNNPLTTFKAETFIVLMTIAWTYLLHEYYRQEGIDYRYPQTDDTATRYWDIKKCIRVENCPLDDATRYNIEFLIGFRNEIEHHQSAGTEERFSGRYLACCLNYERYLCDLFGDKHSLGNTVGFALQFRDITNPPLNSDFETSSTSGLGEYVREFDDRLPDDVFQSPHYSYRVFFKRKLANRESQADRAIEFVDADSPIADSVEIERWVIKETERTKHRPGNVVRMMHEQGYPRFSIHYHTLLWKEMNARDPAKGYGSWVEGIWYWYDNWIEVVRNHCEEHRERFG